MRVIYSLIIMAAAASLPTLASAGPCGADTCWNYTATSSGDAETPADVLKVLQQNKTSPQVAEALQRITIFMAVATTPAVSIQASHWQIGAYNWTGPTICPANDPRLTTLPQFSHEYCLTNGICVPGSPTAPAEKDPCAP